jgi:hypothetical protein
VHLGTAVGAGPEPPGVFATLRTGRQADDSKEDGVRDACVRSKSLILTLGLIVAASGVAPAQADDRTRCSDSCWISFAECAAAARHEQPCLDGSTCSDVVGYCANGRPCGLLPDPVATAACADAYDSCTRTCLNPFEDVRRLLAVAPPFPPPDPYDILTQFEKEIDVLTSRIDSLARQRLGTFRNRIEKLHQQKQLDFGTSFVLQESARRIEVGLRKEALRTRVLDPIALRLAGDNPSPAINGLKNFSLEDSTPTPGNLSEDLELLKAPR